MEIHDLVQGIMMILGCTSIYALTSKSRKVRKVGSIVGLLNEPLWFYAAWVANQWGIMVLVAVYAVMYVRGIINNWSTK